MYVLTVKIEDLAKVCADLVKEGVCFEARPKVNDADLYVIEFTGGY